MVGRAQDRLPDADVVAAPVVATVHNHEAAGHKQQHVGHDFHPVHCVVGGKILERIVRPRIDLEVHGIEVFCCRLVPRHQRDQGQQQDLPGTIQL